MPTNAERDAVECRRLRTAIGEILGCHATSCQSTNLCPKCERLANFGCRGMLADSNGSETMENIIMPTAITTASELAARAVIALCEQFADDMPYVPYVKSALDSVLAFHADWRDDDTLPLEREDIIAHLVESLDWLDTDDLA